MNDSIVAHGNSDRHPPSFCTHSPSKFVVRKFNRSVDGIGKKSPKPAILSALGTDFPGMATPREVVVTLSASAFFLINILLITLMKRSGYRL